ncbi:nuclear transport factor 2 family protein [Luteipulveratus mongoliensis]|uniref:Polyketide cyclase n=1 Tax=Luteipulveratus mongoliensis TaxID=571913 RepID=A0A0K1JIN9_9MICO|nr:nuclear transport factor 2 family protein [Luteipulveratus mongoliensis]AKU16448.1 polyketide cyclase [Luteipulveratus mongoliensis]
MTLDVADRLAIHELMALHGHLADSRGADRLHLLMTDDVVMDVTAYDLGVVDGLEANRRLWTEAPGNQPVGHHVTNVMVSEDDDGTVRVRSKGIAVMADGTTGTADYDDVVVRTPDGWRIARRVVGRRA